MRTQFVGALLLAALAHAAPAQRLPPHLGESAAPVIQQRSDSTAGDLDMAAGGVLGVVGGTYGGIVAGAALERGLSGGCWGEYGCLGGAVLGLVIGEPAAVAAGVHWANHARGSYGSEFAANLGILIAGWFLGSRLDRSSSCRDCGAYLLALGVPIAQIAASIAIEKATARPKD